MPHLIIFTTPQSRRERNDEKIEHLTTKTAQLKKIMVEFSDAVLNNMDNKNTELSYHKALIAQLQEEILVITEAKYVD